MEFNIGKLCVWTAVLAVAMVPSVSARACVLGTEVDADSGSVRSVLSTDVPCDCDHVALGGHNVLAPHRQQPSTSLGVDAVGSADVMGIRRLFQCTDDPPTTPPAQTDRSSQGDQNLHYNGPSNTHPPESPSSTPSSDLDTSVTATTAAVTTSDSSHVTTANDPSPTVHQTTMPQPSSHPGYADCKAVRDGGYATSGVYNLNVSGTPLTVYCDMTDRSGHIVIQRRQDGSVNFNKLWHDYAVGFGDLESEFWLGNNNLKLLTSSDSWELSIYLTAFDTQVLMVNYRDFRIIADNFTLSLGDVNDITKDSLRELSGAAFSTPYVDNDDSDTSCAKRSFSGWWFKDCTPACNLNGQYSQQEAVNAYEGIHWDSWRGNASSLRGSIMKIRRIRSSSL